jgi:hypothetical protein
LLIKATIDNIRFTFFRVGSCFSSSSGLVSDFRCSNLITTFLSWTFGHTLFGATFSLLVFSACSASVRYAKKIHTAQVTFFKKRAGTLSASSSSLSILFVVGGTEAAPLDLSLP